MIYFHAKDVASHKHRHLSSYVVTAMCWLIRRQGVYQFFLKKRGRQERKLVKPEDLFIGKMLLHSFKLEFLVKWKERPKNNSEKMT